ncbi:MAG: hypothetical protein JSR46_02620 [Verrucomicrobia bacterium]|nr:hypothetical protein [Verrucomicrobiota bacterium]
MSKEVLNSKFNVQDPLHIAEFSPSITPYGFKGYSKLPNWEKEIQPIQPVSSTAALASTIRFTFPKRSTFIGQHHLVATISAVTPNGGGTARCVDYAGFRLYPAVVYRYGSNLIQTIDYLTLHMLHRQNKRREERDAEAVLVGGDLSIAERESLALSPQTFYTNMPCWWSYHPSVYLNRDALSHDLEIAVTTCSAGDLTQGTSGTIPSVSLSSLYIRAVLHHVEDDERDYHTAVTLHGNGEVMTIRDFEEQLTNSLPGGQTSYTINLSLLKGLASELRFVFRRTNALTSPGTVNNKPFDYVVFDNDFMSWQIKASGIQVVNSMTGRENIFIHNANDHTGQAGMPFYGYSAAWDVEDFINSTGHHNYGGFSSPQLILTFAADPGALQLDIWDLSLNTVQHVKGEIVKNFL